MQPLDPQSTIPSSMENCYNGSNNSIDIDDTAGAVLLAMVAFLLLLALLRSHRINRQLLHKQIELLQLQR